MNQSQLEKLIQPDTYQVFLFGSLCSFPLCFATHPRFVISDKGNLSRWEILMGPNQCETSREHLHLNFLSPTQGLNILRDNNTHPWSSKLYGYVTGDKNSYIKDMVTYIETSPTHYPYNEHYVLTGPNSNSYAQHVIDTFPQSGLKLPWNSFGKGYVKK